MELVIDSALSFEEAVTGSSAPEGIIAALELIDVDYRSFDEKLHRGQLLVHGSVATEAKEIFAELLSLSFPIQKVIPIVRYGWDDNASMEDNNSSAFNYRKVFGTETLSNHSFGLAIDINPFLNPYEQSDGKIVPEGSIYDVSQPGTFLPESAPVRAFTSRRWDWGGLWSRKDWQHFAKPDKR